MKLVGQAITHTRFGNGVIAENADSIITILFQNVEKKFVFPDAFENFLKLKNEKMQSEVDELICENIEEHKKEELKQSKDRECFDRLCSLRVNTISQAAFCLRENSKEEVFNNWSITSGTYLSGKSKGMLRIPQKMQMNSACLLTECPKGAAEGERRIIGVFMVDGTFDGNLCEDGIITGHDKYRIKLEDSETLLYWDYFSEEGVSKKWGNIEVKYFSNVIMQKILIDMQKKISDEARKKNMQEFIEYFEKMNKM